MTVSGTTSGPELLVELDRARREPLHRQLTDGLREAIRSGRLAAGVRLPSSRVLASDLGVSRRMVVDAYAQLVAEGFLVSQTGAGTYVATVEVATTAAPEDASPVADYTVDFSPGMPDVHSFPRAEWLRALRQGLADLPSKSFGYTEPQGAHDHSAGAGRLSAPHPCGGRRPRTYRAVLGGHPSCRPRRQGSAGYRRRIGSGRGSRILAAPTRLTPSRD